MTTDMWRRFSPGEEAPERFNAVVVTPKDSVNIYAYDHERDTITHSHTIHTPFRPPGDLAFIPRSYNEGGAPLDVLVMSSAPSPPRTVIECRPVALLRMTLDGVRDDSILCVPVNDSITDDTTDLPHVSSHTLEEVERFYDSLFEEQERVLRVDEWLNAEHAEKAVQNALNLYKRRFPSIEIIHEPSQ